MSDGFKKLMLEQVQEALNGFMDLAKKPIPKKGWIRTMREALGMSSYVLANRMDCSRTNITTIEQRERKGWRRQRDRSGPAQGRERRSK